MFYCSNKDSFSLSFSTYYPTLFATKSYVQTWLLACGFYRYCESHHLLFRLIWCGLQGFLFFSSFCPHYTYILITDKKPPLDRYMYFMHSIGLNYSKYDNFTFRQCCLVLVPTHLLHIFHIFYVIL